MAITNSGMTLLTDNDTQQSWAGTDDLDDYNNSIQGSNSESWQVSKNATETGTLTKAADMSGAKYFTFYMSSNLSPYYTDVKLRLGESTSKYDEHTIATSADRMVSGDFHPVVAQISEGTNTGGTVDYSAFDTASIVVDNSTSGNIRSVINNWIDCMWFGDGRTISGTTSSDNLFLESHISDTTTNDNYDGCSELYKGSLAYQTDVTITTTSGNSYGETVTFAGGYNTDDVYKITVTGTTDWNGTSIVAVDGATVGLDTSGATSFDMTGGAITNGGDILFGTGDTVDGAVFTGCAEIDPNNADMDNCVISDTTETTTGSVLINVGTEGDRLSGISFKNYATNSRYAIYVDASVTSFTMDNWQFDSASSYALYWAGTGGTLTISSTNGTNLNLAGCDSAGGTVAISQDVTVEITNVVVGSRVRVDTIDGNGDISTNLILEEAVATTVSTSVNFAGLDYNAVSIRVRKASGGTKYLPYNAGGSISASGLSAQANQQVNPLVDL